MFERLTQAFGDCVFIDHECLVGGEYWRKRIDEVLAQVGIVIVLLTDSWLSDFEACAERGDQVLRELKVTLDLGKRLYPVMLKQARSPTRADAERLSQHPELARVVLALADANTRRWTAISNRNEIALMMDELSQHLPRFPERLRQRTLEALHKQLTCTADSERLRNKFRPLTQAIAREGLALDLQAALEEEPALLVLHAEEGMGKTIALAQLLEAMRVVPVILSDASEALWQKGFEGARDTLLQDFCTNSDVSLTQALPIWIAIDGLNEAAEIDWRGVLNAALDAFDNGAPPAAAPNAACSQHPRADFAMRKRSTRSPYSPGTTPSPSDRSANAPITAPATALLHSATSETTLRSIKSVRWQIRAWVGMWGWAEGYGRHTSHSER